MQTWLVPTHKDTHRERKIRRTATDEQNKKNKLKNIVDNILTSVSEANEQTHKQKNVAGEREKCIQTEVFNTNREVISTIFRFLYSVAHQHNIRAMHRYGNGDKIQHPTTNSMQTG